MIPKQRTKIVLFKQKLNQKIAAIINQIKSAIIKEDTIDDISIDIVNTNENNKDTPPNKETTSEPKQNEQTTSESEQKNQSRLKMN